MIIDLQRRLAEVGRIRIGQQVPTQNGSRPAKLDTFRLTSADRTKIGNAAKLYGGTPREWQAPAGNQWEVITEADALPVIVPPADMAFSQFYELWSAGGCQRRCDGITESLTEGDCLCDPGNRECDIHSRLSVMLADLPGLGVWRVDTSGYYAAVELQAAVEVVRLAAGQMLPAQLRLEQRMVKRDGKTRRFAVPLLDIEIAPRQLLAGGPQQQQLPELPSAADERYTHPPLPPRLTPVPDTVPERPTASIADQAKAEKPKRARSNAQQPVPRTGLKPRTADEARANVKEALPSTLPDEPPPDEPTGLVQPRLITDDQLTKMSILLKEQGFADRETRHGFVMAAINRPIESAKDLTLDEASLVIDILENSQTPEQEMDPRSS